MSKIKAGEEITLTYNWKQLAMKDWKTRQDNLWYNWGFRQAYSSFDNFSMTIILWGKIPSLFNILSRFNNSTVGRFFLLTGKKFLHKCQPGVGRFSQKAIILSTWLKNDP